MEIRSYSCRVRGRPETAGTIVNASSAGKARYRFWLDVSDALPDVKLIDIVVRSFGAPVDPKGFKENAEYRQVPFVHTGMKVKVCGRYGRIVGHNSSANLDIEFDDGDVGSCHPNTNEIQYFDDGGNLIEAVGMA